jgi:hypothetical protein
MINATEVTPLPARPRHQPVISIDPFVPGQAVRRTVGHRRHTIASVNT